MSFSGATVKYNVASAVAYIMLSLKRAGWMCINRRISRRHVHAADINECLERWLNIPQIVNGGYPWRETCLKLECELGMCFHIASCFEFLTLSIPHPSFHCLICAPWRAGLLAPCQSRLFMLVLSWAQGSSGARSWTATWRRQSTSWNS